MRKIMLLLIGVLILGLTACDQGNNKSSTTTTDPFIGGTEGLVMSFVTGMPPDYIFDNGGYNFGVGLQIDNVGEYSVPEGDGYIEIIGFNPSDFGKNSQSDLKKFTDVEIQGAKKNFEGTELPGGRTVIEFSDFNYQPDLSGNSGIKVRAEMCYNYKTFTSTKICVKKNLLDNIANEKICDLSGEKEVRNSGAPVHITSFKEAPMGENKIQFNFVVENVRAPAGTIFKRDAECDDSITNQDLNKVWMEIRTPINGVKPECSGIDEGADRSEGYITLFSGEPRTVTCTLDITGVDSIFEVPSYEIVLEYNYMQYLERPLEIRDVSTSG